MGHGLKLLQLFHETQGKHKNKAEEKNLFFFKMRLW